MASGKSLELRKIGPTTETRPACTKKGCRLTVEEHYIRKGKRKGYMRAALEKEGGHGFRSTDTVSIGTILRNLFGGTP